MCPVGPSGIVDALRIVLLAAAVALCDLACAAMSFRLRGWYDCRIVLFPLLNPSSSVGARLMWCNGTGYTLRGSSTPSHCTAPTAGVSRVFGLSAVFSAGSGRLI